MNLPLWLPFGRVPELDADALYAMLHDGSTPQFIDVRTTLEYRRGPIASASGL